MNFRAHAEEWAPAIRRKGPLVARMIPLPIIIFIVETAIKILILFLRNGDIKVEDVLGPIGSGPGIFAADMNVSDLTVWREIRNASSNT